MEPQSSFFATHTDDSDPTLKWFLHHSRLQEHEKIEGFRVGMDKFWEGQWSCHMKDWAAFNRQGQVIDQNLVQSCDSPVASDSSSSVSTRESSFLSWNSENSYITGRNVLQSPELLSSRFAGFSLFNSGSDQLEAVSQEGVLSERFLISEEQQERFLLPDGDLLHRLVELNQRTRDGSNVECSRHLDSNFDTAESVKGGVSTVAYGQSTTINDYVNDGWVSDSSDSQSWSSTSSQKLLRKDAHGKAYGMLLGRPCTDHECPLSTSSTQAGNSGNQWHADDASLRQGYPMSLTAVLRNSSTNILGSNHTHDTAEACESMSYALSYKETASSSANICRCDSWRFGSDNILCEVCGADVLKDSNLISVEKLCVTSTQQPCRLRFESETYQTHLIQDYGSMAHNSDTSILYERHMSDECVKRHGTEGSCELSEHAGVEHKSDKISQDESVRVDSKAKLLLAGSCKHPNIVVSTSLQPGNVKMLSSHTKSRYSAAVKESSASPTVHGYLRFAEQGGSPCYSFFVDDSDEVLFARACRQEKRSNKENCDWTYTFHSKKDNGKTKGAWKGWPKKEKPASDLVANMKVPGVSHSDLKGNQDGRAKEARFVLYDGRGQQHVESQAIGNDKIRVQPLKPVFGNMAASQTEYAKQRVEPYIINHDPNSGHVNIRPGQNKSDHSKNNTVKNGSIHTGNSKTASGSKDSIAGKLDVCHLQQAELAAIVISTSVKERKKTRRKESKSSQKDNAGWGIKFLDKGSESGWGLSFMEKPSNNGRGVEEMHSCRGPDGQPECIGAQTTGDACQRNMAKFQIDKGGHAVTFPDLAQKPEKKMISRKNKLMVDVTVILPAGDHSLPMEDEENVGSGGGSHGPTPLLERWVSGGECECGGWDMGCGLSVFKAETLTLRKRTANIALTRHDRMNWLSPGNPFKLFTQGYKQKKVLVLEIIEGGLFSLTFQAQFSPLQAFSIAVALFHQQMTHK